MGAGTTAAADRNFAVVPSAAGFFTGPLARSMGGGCCDDLSVELEDVPLVSSTTGFRPNTGFPPFPPNRDVNEPSSARQPPPHRGRTVYACINT